MIRFLPAQLKQWTAGELLQTTPHASDPERFYPSISTDSRTIQPGEVFVPLRGDRFDGHRFLFDAIDRGAAMAVIARDAEDDVARCRALVEDDPNAPDILIVDDTWNAYQAIAAGFRSTLTANVIGVTGSVGKTTTRRMIHAMIASQVKAEQSERNYNNQVGLPRTILATDDSTQALVAELGMDAPGEIRKLTHIARPDIAIITTIGISHAEHLGGMREVLREKTSILEGMKDNGLIVVNGDDPMLEGWVSQDPTTVPIWYIASKQNVGHLERDGIPVFWAEDIRETPEGIAFVGRTNLTPDERWPIALCHPGHHLVPAALFGLAVAYVMGLDMDEAAASATHYTPGEGRQSMHRVGAVDVMDDAYNASPQSLHAALVTAQRMAVDHRRWLTVFGGMRELGRYSKTAHKEAAEALLDAGVDRIYLVGEETETTRDALLSHPNGADRLAGWYPTTDDVIDAVLRDLADGDFLLLKGSRFYALERVLDAMRQREREGSRCSR
ncbi:MAG: UDP-N-acetylmuramoyl-tripeptide--D-alanyl-D-alanine ligase [Saccharofermentanales bacterium]|jgi:UDP-N-acetylmuramoyl-tripeptide--D-alanyl-D-alanine ligase